MSVNWVNIGPDNGLSPIRRQAIIWTSAGLLSIGHLGTFLIKTQNFSLTKMHLKMASVLFMRKWVQDHFMPGSIWIRRFYNCIHNSYHVNQWVGTNEMNSKDQLLKSHDAPVPCPTMHHFVTEICACFCYKMLHYGTFVWCIVGFVRWVYCHDTGMISPLCFADFSNIMILFLFE